MRNNHTSRLSATIDHFRREIQTTWSDAERSRRRQIAERRQRALLRLLLDGGGACSPTSRHATVPAA